MPAPVLDGRRQTGLTKATLLFVTLWQLPAVSWQISRSEPNFADSRRQLVCPCCQVAFIAAKYAKIWLPVLSFVSFVFTPLRQFAIASLFDIGPEPWDDKVFNFYYV